MVADVSARPDPLLLMDDAIEVLPDDTFVLGQGFRSKRADDLRQVRADVAALVEAAQRTNSAFRALCESTPWTREAERARHECGAAMLALEAALAPFGDGT